MTLAVYVVETTAHALTVLVCLMVILKLTLVVSVVVTIVHVLTATGFLTEI